MKRRKTAFSYDCCPGSALMVNNDEGVSALPAFVDVVDAIKAAKLGVICELGPMRNVGISDRYTYNADTGETGNKPNGCEKR